MDAVKVEAQKLTPQQEDYIEIENHCCLCGTELQFQFQTDETASKLKEKAHCPCCNIQLKEKEYSIQ